MHHPWKALQTITKLHMVQSANLPRRPLVHRCGDGVPKSPGSSDRTGKFGKEKGEGGCFEAIKEKKGNCI